MVRIHLASGHQCGPVTSRDEVTDSWYKEMTVSVIPTTVNIVKKINSQRRFSVGGLSTIWGRQTNVDQVVYANLMAYRRCSQ